MNKEDDGNRLTVSSFLQMDYRLLKGFTLQRGAGENGTGKTTGSRASTLPTTSSSSTIGRIFDDRIERGIESYQWLHGSPGLPLSISENHHWVGLSLATLVFMDSAFRFCREVIEFLWTLHYKRREILSFDDPAKKYLILRAYLSINSLKRRIRGTTKPLGSKNHVMPETGCSASDVIHKQ